MFCGTNLHSEFLTHCHTRGQQILFSWQNYITSVSIILQLVVLYTIIFVKQKNQKQKQKKTSKYFFSIVSKACRSEVFLTCSDVISKIMCTAISGLGSKHHSGC